MATPALPGTLEPPTLPSPWHFPHRPLISPIRQNIGLVTGCGDSPKSPALLWAYQTCVMHYTRLVAMGNLSGGTRDRFSGLFALATRRYALLGQRLERYALRCRSSCRHNIPNRPHAKQFSKSIIWRARKASLNRLLKHAGSGTERLPTVLSRHLSCSLRVLSPFIMPRCEKPDTAKVNEFADGEPR